MKSKNIIRRTFSYSQLNTFTTCPQRYKIIYLDGVRKKHESIEAFVGKLVHGVLEWLYSCENMKRIYITFDHLCQVYDDQWVTAWHQHIYIADAWKKTDYYYKMGKNCLSNYYRRYSATNFDQRVKGTEVELKFAVGDYIFRGIIDRLDHPDPGKWIVHDYKTSKHPKSKRQAMNDIQLALYQIGVQQNYKEVDNISLTWHFLRNGSEVSVTHTPKQQEKLIDKLVKIVDKIIACGSNENNFLPKETLLCNWCYYWEECSAKVGQNQVKRAD